MIHSEAARRWNNDQRKRKIRRLYYNAMDAAGFILWAMVVIIAAACVVFLLWHK